MAVNQTRRMPDPQKLAIGSRIREARERLGWSQHELAKRLDITAGAVGQWELGLAAPSMETFEVLPEILEVTGDWLRRGETRGSDLKAHTKSEAQVLKIMRTMEHDQVNMLVGAAQALAGSKNKGSRS